MIPFMIAAAVLIFLLAAAYVVTVKIFETAFTRIKTPVTEDGNYVDSLEKSGVDVSLVRAGRLWYEKQKWEDIYITSRDGLRLHAIFLPAERDAGKFAVLVHGYHGSPVGDFGSVLEKYHNEGFDLLMPEQRTHGLSEGRYITFGSNERYDIVDWCRYAAARKSGQKILLSGISMGCTTVLLAAAEPDMPELTYILADCGYTSPYSIFSDVLKAQYHLPAFPTLAIADLVCRRRAGFSFREFDTTEAVKHLRAPVTFVHGEADKFVNIRNSCDNYAACPSQKELITVPDAGHGLSYLVDTPRLNAAIDKIFAAYFG